MLHARRRKSKRNSLHIALHPLTMIEVTRPPQCRCVNPPLFLKKKKSDCFQCLRSIFHARRFYLCSFRFFSTWGGTCKCAKQHKELVPQLDTVFPALQPIWFGTEDKLTPWETNRCIGSTKQKGGGQCAQTQPTILTIGRMRCKRGN